MIDSGAITDGPPCKRRSGYSVVRMLVAEVVVKAAASRPLIVSMLVVQVLP